MLDEENKEITRPQKAFTKKMTEETKKSLINRFIMSIALILICVPCIILGDYFFLCLIFVGAVITTHEITKSPQSVEKKFKNIIYLFAYVMIVWLIFWVFLKNNLALYYADKESYSFSLYAGFDTPFISIIAFAICIVFFFLMVFIDETFTLQDAFYFIIMLFIVSIGFQSILYLRFLPYVDLVNTLSTSAVLNQASMDEVNAILSSGTFKYLQSAALVIFFLMGVCLNDVGGYIFGMLFGKHKMLPRISPKKTWEGFIGGVVLSATCTLIFAFLLAYFGYPILNILDLDHWYNIVILSLLMPLVGSLGDLMFSAVKRSYNIKDFGQILKSHGGLLDRLDSILITAIALGGVLPIMENAWIVYL